jgi:hypothetical protein
VHNHFIVESHNFYLLTCCNAISLPRCAQGPKAPIFSLTHINNSSRPSPPFPSFFNPTSTGCLDFAMIHPLFVLHQIEFCCWPHSFPCLFSRTSSLFGFSREQFFTLCRLLRMAIFQRTIDPPVVSVVNVVITHSAVSESIALIHQTFSEVVRVLRFYRSRPQVLI